MKDLRGNLHRPADGQTENLKRGAGLVDAHVHVTGAVGLNAAAKAGIIAVRDAGVRGNAIRGKNSIDLDGGPVRVISARWALYKKGGYGSLFGVPAETPEEIRSAIYLLKNSGAGIIKAMASGIVSLKEPGRMTVGGFNKDELRLIVQEAANCGLGVMAHVNGEHAIIDAAEAGVRSIEHGFFMSERAIEIMATKSTFWVPTIGALKRSSEARGVSPEAVEFVAGLIGSHLEMLLRAYRIGVPLAVGTDCVLPDPRYAEAYDAELAYFEQAGISPREVTKIAGEDGARLLGIGTEGRSK